MTLSRRRLLKRAVRNFLRHTIIGMFYLAGIALILLAAYLGNQ